MARGTLAAGFAALLATAALATTALAGPATTGKTVDATGTVTPATAAEPAAEATGCTKARRRLWVEGEGWIVRRITTCH